MQARRRPWLTLVACLAAVGAARAQGTPSDVIAAPAESLATTAPADAANSSAIRNWRLAPVRISGSVSYNLRSTFGDDEAGTMSHLVTTALDASTYIYQPWFATLNGTLGLTVGSSRSRRGALGLDNPSVLDQGSASKDRFITGSARLDLFPKSRFPLEFHLDRSDSRVDSALASTFDYTTQNIGFSQRFQPANGAYSLAVRYDHREQKSAGASSIQDQLGGEFSTRWTNQDLSLSLALSQARREETGERSQFASLVAQHQYRPAKPLSISSTFNATQNSEKSSAFASDFSLLQWSSVGIWQRESSKVQLSGSARGLLVRDAVTGRDVANGGVSLGASYQLNKNVGISASAGANVTRGDGASSQALSANAGVNWQGDSLEFSGFRYSMYAGANGGSSIASGAGGGSQTQSSASVQAGHSIDRSWLLPLQSTLSLSAAQSLSASHISQGGSTSHGIDTEENLPRPSSPVMLLQTLGATWSVGGGNRTGYARASYSDSRDVGGGDAQFQMFNFQLSGNIVIDRNQSLTGDLTFQRSSQGVRTLQGVQSTGVELAGLTPNRQSRSGSAGGSISYTHNRLFGVPRLRFTSRLNLAQDVLREPGAFAQLADRETRFWENRLDWRIGLMETQLELRMSQVDGRRRGAVSWRLVRRFGR